MEKKATTAPAKQSNVIVDTETQQLTPNEVNGLTVSEIESVQDGLIVQDAEENPAQLLAGFEALEQTQLQELTSAYFNFDTKGVYNFIFAAMTTFKKDNGEIVDAVTLIDKDGATLLNANSVLVNSLKKVTQMPCFVRVEYLGDVRAKNGAGTYKNLKVYVLPATVKQ